MPPHQRFRLDNRYDLQDRRKPSIHLEQKPAIVVRKLGPTYHLRRKRSRSAQSSGKLSRFCHSINPDRVFDTHNRVLSLKPHLRLEWRGQDGQNETEQPDHSASLGDSITSSTRIRFLVHTAVWRSMGPPNQIRWLPTGCRSIPPTARSRSTPVAATTRPTGFERSQPKRQQ